MSLVQAIFSPFWAVTFPTRAIPSASTRSGLKRSCKGKFLSPFTRFGSCEELLCAHPKFPSLCSLLFLPVSRFSRGGHKIDEMAARPAYQYGFGRVAPSLQNLIFLPRHGYSGCADRTALWDHYNWQRFPATLFSVSTNLPFLCREEKLSHVHSLFNVLHSAEAKRSFYGKFLVIAILLLGITGYLFV